jgi:hypothetical protein
LPCWRCGLALGQQQIQEIKTQYEQRSDVDRIAPGEFQESANGARVFFIDKDTPTRMRPAMSSSPRASAGESVTSAQSARLEIAGRAHGAARRPAHGDRARHAGVRISRV